MPGGNDQTTGRASGLEGGIKLSDLIPKFDGTTDVSQWLQQLNVARVAAGISDVALIMPAFLRGNAFTVYANLPEDQQRSYQAIAAALTSAFGVDEHVAYRELVARRLRDGEPVDVFVADLRRLASLADMPERSVRMAFLNGLPSRVEMAVKTAPGVKGMSMAQVIDLARVLMATSEATEARLATEAGETTWVDIGAAAASGGARGGRGRPRQAGWRFRCYRCGEEGHMVRECPQPRVGDARRGSEMTQGQSGSENAAEL